MSTDNRGNMEARLRAVEDRLAIMQLVCGYGYAVDGCNAEAVGAAYAEDGVYAVGDVGALLDGDRASTTCHTMVIMHTEKGFFVGRLSASRLELSRKPDGGWQINHRQNYLLDGAAAGPGLLARLREGPQAPSVDRAKTPRRTS
jgi:hypothetical protein